jgi:hypothetical protein
METLGMRYSILPYVGLQDCRLQIAGSTHMADDAVIGFPTTRPLYICFHVGSGDLGSIHAFSGFARSFCERQDEGFVCFGLQ